MFPINPAFRRLVGDYEDKSQLEFECGEQPKGGIIFGPVDTVEDLKNCGASGEDYETEPPQAMQGGNKAMKAYPWMEHMCFNLCSQVHWHLCCVEESWKS